MISTQEGTYQMGSLMRAMDTFYREFVFFLHEFEAVRTTRRNWWSARKRLYWLTPARAREREEWIRSLRAPYMLDECVCVSFHISYACSYVSLNHLCLRLHLFLRILLLFVCILSECVAQTFHYSVRALSLSLSCSLYMSTCMCAVSSFVPARETESTVYRNKWRSCMVLFFGETGASWGLPRRQTFQNRVLFCINVASFQNWKFYSGTRIRPALFLIGNVVHWNRAWCVGRLSLAQCARMSSS